MNFPARSQWALGLLVLFHLSGAVGFFSPFQAWFVSLTPLNLLASFVVLVWAVGGLSRRDVLGLSVIAVLGIVAEVVGVATGLVFGDYAYGSTLGWKVLGVPWLIGLNWALLVWAGNALLARSPLATWLQPWAVGCVLVALDLLIEPVAMAFDFWDWERGVVPLQNYVAWFCLSVVFSFILRALMDRELKRDGVMGGFLAVQFGFFGLGCFGLAWG